MNRIDRTFARLRDEGMRALIAYLTAGDPHPTRTVELILALERGGADIIELGVPFSDPLADGPTIQKASERALKAGMSLAGVMEIVRELRKRSDVPVVIFSYLNPVLRYGYERFANTLVEVQADGALLTDLNIEAADDYLALMRERDLSTVFLGAQTNTDERLARVAQASTGFLYLVSTAGVTGMRETVSDQAVPLLERARRVSDVPLAIGFGLSRREHMEAVAPYAEGAIVGSAIMRIVEEHGNSEGLERRLEELARELKSGLRAPAAAVGGER